MEKKKKKEGESDVKILVDTKRSILICPDRVWAEEATMPEEWETAQQDCLVESWNEEILEIVSFKPSL